VNNLVWHDHKVTKKSRSNHKNQKSCLIWFTGLSGSGKSTVANALDEWLFENQYHTYLLDGDNVRHGLNKDLGFTDDDRVENIRRVGEVSGLFVDAGLITLSAFISPFLEERKMVREMFDPGEFIEIYISTSLEICEGRDPKGMYQKARSGEIKHFTGVSSEYEAPTNAEIVLDAGALSVEESVGLIIDYLVSYGILSRK